MLDPLVRRRHQPQRLAPMAQLSARLLTALLAQALRLALQAVTAGGLAAIVAILGQAGFKVADVGPQLLDPLALLRDHGFQFGDPFLSGHGSMLPPLRKSARPTSARASHAS